MPATATARLLRSLSGSFTRYLKLREIIRQASGETIDLKAYEADMRHLIDTYIQGRRAPGTISDFGETILLDLIVRGGASRKPSTTLRRALKGNKDAVAETIANNVRSKIIKEHLKRPGVLRQDVRFASRKSSPTSRR